MKYKSKRKKIIKKKALQALVLMLAMVSFYFIGITFSKYITSFSTEPDTAHVAEWGIELESNADLFGNAYSNKASGNTPTAWVSKENDTSITVQANAESADVLAPGTKNSLTILEVTGDPDVDVEVNYIFSSEFKDWEVSIEDSNGNSDEVFYCPLVFKIYFDNSTTPTIIDGKDYTSATALSDKLKEVIDTNSTTTIHAGQGQTTKNVIFSWEWPYETNDINNDKKDFALCNAAVRASVEFSYSVTATQVD